MLEDLKIPPEYDGFLFLAEAARNPPVLQSHRHAELEINLVVRGGITYIANGSRYRFDRRTLLWFFPSQEHQLVDRTPDAQYYVAVFKPSLIVRSCSGEAYRGLAKKSAGHDILHTGLEPETFDLMKLTMESLMRGALDPDLLNREAGFGYRSDFVFRHGDPDGLNAGLHHLLMLSWRCRHNGRALGRPVSLHPAVVSALRLLGEGYTDLDLGQIASRCGVSASYLSRVFHAQVGVPLRRYRNSLRLRGFWEALGGTARPTLTEAVYQAGFGSYAQFYKVFASVYGAGPREVLALRDI